MTDVRPDLLPFGHLPAYDITEGWEAVYVGDNEIVTHTGKRVWVHLFEEVTDEEDARLRKLLLDQGPFEIIRWVQSRSPVGRGYVGFRPVT